MFQFLIKGGKSENANFLVARLRQFLRRCVATESIGGNDLGTENEIQIEKYREQKTYKKYFIENLFLGLFEPEALEFPQIRTKIEVDQMKEHRERAHNLIVSGIDEKGITCTGRILKEMYDSLEKAELMGMKIKTKNSGLGYFESESSYLQECLYLNSSLGKFVAENENSSCKLVQLFASDSQKRAYLQNFLSGKCISSLAHVENDSWISKDSSSIKTTALQKEDGSFVISGKKSLVYNPNCSDMLVVSAKVTNINDNDSYTLFMVNKNSKGLSILNPVEKYSLKEIELCDVIFENIIVPGDQIIGEINGGSRIIDKLLSHGKLSNGTQCIGVMRKLVNDAITHCIQCNHFNRPLYKYKYIQGKIGEILQTLYIAESITYLMTGRIDEDPNLDAKLESFIVKIFNSEALNFILYNYMHLVGKDKCNEEFIASLLEDIPFYVAFDEPNSYLKAVLATVGVKHLLSQMSHSTIKQYKPMSKAKLKVLEYLEYEKRDDLLSGYLHLALYEDSKILNFCVWQLNFLSELLIAAHGNESLAKPYCLGQLADLAIIIYKLTAVLGRASRALCIGLRNSECDIRLARNVAQCSYQEAKVIYNNIIKNLKKVPTDIDMDNYISASEKFSWVHPAKPVS